MRFYVVGGRQRSGYARNEWNRYDRGVIMSVDSERGRVEKVFEYTSPASACALDEKPAILFKAGHLDGDRMYVCTSTEVLILKVPSFERLGYMSLPSFNDLHHVAPVGDGTLAVVSTGLDLVQIINLNGEVLREHSTTERPPWTGFSRATDYRFVLTTKPHASHPNYCFRLDGKLWVTRFEQRDAICLEDRSDRFGIGLERPHDGVVHEGRVYFTTVDGRVWVFDSVSRRLEASFDLNAISGKGNPLGWCRGILPLSGRRVVVGFSRIRPTQHQETLAWVRRQFGGKSPTEPARIAIFDLGRKRLDREFSLEDHGLHAIFSIHRAE